MAKKNEKKVKKSNSQNKIRSLLNKIAQLEKQMDALRQEINYFSNENRNLSKNLKNREKEIQEASEIVQRYIDAIEEIKAEYDEAIAKLTNPPCSYGIFVGKHPDGKENEIDILLHGDLKKVLLVKDKYWPATKNIKVEDLKCGWQVICNPKENVIGVIKNYWYFGNKVTLHERLTDDTALVSDGMDSLKQCFLSPELKSEKLKKGDPLLECGGLIVKILPKTEQAERFMDIKEIKDLSFKDIGGLEKQIEEIKEALLPFRERDVYINEFKGKKPVRGIILDGPPGCGKTLTAKIIAAELARWKGVKGYFMEVGGPELNNKYVGVIEERLRDLVNRAEEKAVDGNVVVIFIDELDALIRDRGTSMDKEPWKADTVAQFNILLDGVKTLGDIMFIGATNIKYALDSAVLRDSRLGVHIHIPRPNKKGAIEILKIHLTSDLPFHSKYFQDEYEYIDHFGDGKKKKIKLDKDPDKIKNHFIEMIINRIFYTGNPVNIYLDDDGGERKITINNKLLVLTGDGFKETYFKKFISGDMLAGIVEKAKRIALKRYIWQKKNNPEIKPAITKKDFFLAIDEKFRNVTSEYNYKKEKTENEKRRIGFDSKRDKDLEDIEE